MDAAAWAAQPAARRVDLRDDCAPRSAAAVAPGTRLLVIDGDATIAGPAAFGSADDPIVLVASGALRFDGDVEMHGVVHAAALEWSDADAGPSVRPRRVVVAGGYARQRRRRSASRRGRAGRLAAGNGSFVRVNGSWKDF